MVFFILQTIHDPGWSNDSSSHYICLLLISSYSHPNPATWNILHRSSLGFIFLGFTLENISCQLYSTLKHYCSLFLQGKLFHLLSSLPLQVKSIVLTARWDPIINLMHWPRYQFKQKKLSCFLFLWLVTSHSCSVILWYFGVWNKFYPMSKTFRQEDFLQMSAKNWVKCLSTLLISPQSHLENTLPKKLLPKHLFILLQS